MSRNRSETGTLPLSDISSTTIPIAGLLVDIYGLKELPSDVPITCLWLLHPRTYTKAHMRDIASRTVFEWTNDHSELNQDHGLLALAFDMPNHGSRMVSEQGNMTWSEGNPNHAMDMLGMVKRAGQDLTVLLDLIEGFLMRGHIERHISLGWSLGGHVSWAAWFSEQRIDAAVVMLGCPDFIGLMRHREKGSNSEASDSSVASTHVPVNLRHACLSHDPKSILFNNKAVPTIPLSSDEQRRLRPILDKHIRGKKLLVCAGADDSLVPSEISKPLLNVLKDAVAETGWYSQNAVVIEERVYEGLGHEVSDEMVQDVVKWVTRTVAQGYNKKDMEKAAKL